MSPLSIGVLASSYVAPAGFTTITDTFNRSDSTTTLGTTDTGETWTAHVGTWGIKSSAAYPVAGSGDTFATVDTGVTAGYTATVTFVTGGANMWKGLMFRYVDASNQYWIEQDQNGNAYIFRTIGGTRVTLKSFGVAIDAGTVIAVQVTDDGTTTTIAVYKNGSAWGTAVTDSTSGRPAGTRVGLRNYGATSVGTFDNFSVEAL